MVVDHRRQFVGYIDWAVARRALKEERVTVYRRSPFAVCLPPGETKLPSFRVVAERTKQMSNTNGNINDMRGNGVMNWLRFFQEERDIWVQNLSNTQLSMQFEVAQGQTQGYLVPITPDPVCLTQEIPFEAIKRSFDFKRFLNCSPPIMKVLSEEEVQDHYRKKAADMGAFTRGPGGERVPDVSKALAQADADRKAAKAVAPGDVSTYNDAQGNVAFAPPKTAQELAGMNMPQHMGVPTGAAQAAGLQQVPQGFVNGPANLSVVASSAEQQPLMTEQIIKPRVIHLCQQVSATVPPNQRPNADALFRELKPMANSLTLDDLQYIEAHGAYPTVKKWAHALIDDRMATTEGPAEVSP